MAGYWIIRGNLRDADALQQYIDAFQPLGERYQVELVVAAGSMRTVEGPEFGRHMVLRFPSYQQALDCYDDADYQALLPLVERAQQREMVIVEG